MNNFLNALENEANKKFTENGAEALSSTMNALIDLFGTIGAMRERTDTDIINSFVKAYAEDKLLAMKILFYTRDIREGLGERRAFKVIANYLAKNHPDEIKKNMPLIAEYGRWDDYYCFYGTDLFEYALEIMKDQFFIDLENLSDPNKSVSLLGKWLKSTNASSAETRKLGLETAKAFYPMNAKINPVSAEILYRKALAKLRTRIDIVEKKMSSNEWNKINYENVPSIASHNYSDAFIVHDEARYREFLAAVEKGEKEIKAGAIMPYDLVKNYFSDYDIRNNVNKTVEAQWKALPNFVQDKNFLIMTDTSGSMYSYSNQAIATSVSLAIYFAERNKGEYHGKFMRFASQPKFFSIPDNLSLYEKVKLVVEDNYYGSTNLKAAFDQILASAINGKVKQEEMPEALVVISDMEIDSYSATANGVHFTKAMSKKFEEAGYKMPVIVWWNVNARQDTFHALNDENVRFVSGSSPAVFKGLCENLGYSAKELMLSVLNSERYSKIKI